MQKNYHEICKKNDINHPQVETQNSHRKKKFFTVILASKLNICSNSFI